MEGLVGYGAYIPYYRLERGKIAGVLGSGGGRGTRSVAAYDEDTTSLAVAAGRAALTGLDGPGRASVRQLFFATAVPAYADKTNALRYEKPLSATASAASADGAEDRSPLQFVAAIPRSMTVSEPPARWPGATRTASER